MLHGLFKAGGILYSTRYNSDSTFHPMLIVHPRLPGAGYRTNRQAMAS